MDRYQKLFSSYHHLFNTAYQTATTTTHTDAHDSLRYFFLDMPGVPLMLTFHVLAVSLGIFQYTKGRYYWLKSLVITTLAAFGGSTLANLLAGFPIPLFTVYSNYLMSYIFVAWYLVNHSLPFRTVLLFRPIFALLAFSSTASKARAVIGFVDAFRAKFPGIAAGAIILGGMAGSGGSLFLSADRTVMYGLDTPGELSSPSWGFKSAYMASAAYYILSDPDDALAALPFPWKLKLDRDDVRFYITLFMATHALVKTLYGADINPFWWFEDLLFAVSGAVKEPYRHPVQKGKKMDVDGIVRRLGKNKDE